MQTAVLVDGPLDGERFALPDGQLVVEGITLNEPFPVIRDGDEFPSQVSYTLHMYEWLAETPRGSSVFAYIRKVNPPGR